MPGKIDSNVATRRLFFFGLWILQEDRFSVGIFLK
jgi:hypothetical protein